MSERASREQELTEALQLLLMTFEGDCCDEYDICQGILNGTVGLIDGHFRLLKSEKEEQPR